MATGEKTFSSGGREVKRFESTPVPAQDWEGKFHTGKIAIRVAQGVGKLPYIDAPIECLDSAPREGGKNRFIFHRFFLTVDPSNKDGVAMIDRQNQLVALTKAVNMELTGVRIQAKTKVDDEGNESQAAILNPQQVVAWLKQLDGVVFKFHSKIEKGTNGYSDKAVVDYFIESEGDETSASEEVEFGGEEEGTDIEAEGEELPAEDEAPEMEADADEEAAPEIDEEEAPPPARKVSAAPRAAQKMTGTSKNGVSKATPPPAKGKVAARTSARR